MNVKTITVTTSAAGAYAGDARLSGQVLAVHVDLGSLDTPDITLTDLDSGDSVLTAAGVAASKVYLPRRVVQLGTDGTDLAPIDAPFVGKTLHVVIAGGGNKKTGTLRVAYR